MIRVAQPKDSQDIKLLLMQLGYPSLALEEIENKITYYHRQDYKIYVLEMDHRVIGFISLHFYESFHSAGKIGRITAFCVHDQFQSKGFGKQLLNEAEKYFVESGCIKLEVTSNKRREQAHDFYLRQGYIEDSRKFVKILR